MTDQLRQIRANFDKPKAVSRTTHDGAATLVVPVVMIVEGVLNGSLLTRQEFGKFVDSWNGRPVPVLHPEENGEPISASRPDIVERNTIGHVFNAHVDQDRLKGELWININKATRLGHETLISALESGEVVEVSTGYFSEFKNEPGDFGGVAYDRVDVNIRPDHLALLPGQIGACSVADGCGTRVNQQSNRGIIAMSKTATKGALETLAKALGFRANCNCNEETVMTVKQKLQKQAEKLKANGKLSAEQIEMLMSMDPEQLAMVDALATTLGEAAPATEEEPAEMVDELEPELVEEEPVMMAEKATANKGTITAADIDRIVANRMDRADVTRRLIANTACVFSEDEMGAMTVNHLKKYEASIRPVDYSGQGGFATNGDATTEEGYQPLTIHAGLTAREQEK